MAYEEDRNEFNLSPSWGRAKFHTHQTRTFASLVTQVVKNPPAMEETWVWSLRQEDPLEKGMATHSSIFAWEIPWTEEPVRLQSMRWQRVGHDWATNMHTHIDVSRWAGLPLWLFLSFYKQCTLLIGGWLLYNIVVVFAIHWHESATGAHVSPYPELLSLLPPHPILWVVSEHQFWMPCFMPRACTGHLFYIW